MNFTRFLKQYVFNVKQPKYKGQITLPYDIEQVYQTIPTLYGGAWGFAGSQIENISNPFGATLAYRTTNGTTARYLLSKAGEKSTQIEISTETPTGHALFYFEDIVKALKKKLEK